MQQKATNPEQNLINELNSLILSIKSAKPGITEEKIAVELGYKPGQIAQSRSRGTISKRFIDSLKQYLSRLQNSTHNITPVKEETQKEGLSIKLPLEIAIEHLSESKLVDSKNIERLIGLLEIKFRATEDLKAKQKSSGK